MRSSAIRTVIAAMAALVAGCGTSPESRPTPAEPTSKVDAGTTVPSPQASSIARLGDIPEFPQGPLPEPVAASLQAVLDDAVKQGTFHGVTAAVIVADSGSWSGATGIDLEGKPLTPDAQLLTASAGKTVTAAQVLRLVDEGKLGLDDPAADHLPPEVAFFAANGATIRDVRRVRRSREGRGCRCASPTTAWSDADGGVATYGQGSPWEGERKHSRKLCTGAPHVLSGSQSS